MLPTSSERNLQQSLIKAIALPDGTLPTVEQIVKGPHGARRTIRPWEELGLVSVKDTYTLNNSTRIINVPVVENPPRIGIGGIHTINTLGRISVELPTFQQSSQPDVVLHLRLHEDKALDAATMRYDTKTGELLRGDILVASSERPGDYENEEELDVNQKFTRFLTILSDASQKEKDEIRVDCRTSVEYHVFDIEGIDNDSPEVIIFHEEIAPAIITSMIKAVAEDRAEANVFKQLLSDIDFSYAITGEILRELGTKENVVELVAQWQDKTDTENIGQIMLEFFEDLPIGQKDNDMSADLTTPDPLQAGKNLKGSLLAEEFEKQCEEAIDTIEGMFTSSHNSPDEEHIALGVDDNGKLLTFQAYSLSGEQQRTDGQSGVLDTEATTISIQDQDVEINVNKANVITLTWLSLNRRGGRMPTRTATFQRNIPVDEIVEKAVNVNLPVNEATNLLHASIREL